MIIHYIVGSALILFGLASILILGKMTDESEGVMAVAGLLIMAASAIVMFGAAWLCFTTAN